MVQTKSESIFCKMYLNAARFMQKMLSNAKYQMYLFVTLGGQPDGFRRPACFLLFNLPIT